MIIKESIICDLSICTKKRLGGSMATKAPNVAQANLFLTSLEKSMMNIKFKKTYQQTNLSTKRKSIYLKSKQQNFTQTKSLVKGITCISNQLTHNFGLM